MKPPTLLFLCGPLCHAPLLRAILGSDAEPQPASLSGSKLLRDESGAWALLCPDEGQAVEGALVDTPAAGLGRLEFYAEVQGLDLTTVTVRTPTGEKTASLLVRAPDGAKTAVAWDLDDWIARHGSAAVTAAEELMGLMGGMTAGEARRRLPTILIRAYSRQRAAAETSPRKVRRGGSAGSVEVLETRRPYTDYFAVAEQDLRFPHFDGGRSVTVTRAAFLMGDAVTVLPYDPVRDLVLVVEQFRFGPYSRGDGWPWVLEPVAGRIDPGETPEAAARRETQEEAGVRLAALHQVGAYYVSPGAVSEYLFSYLGIADLPDGSGGIGGVPGEAEDILGHLLSFDELMDLVQSGEAATAPLILSAQWLALNRDRLRSDAGGSAP